MAQLLASPYVKLIFIHKHPKITPMKGIKDAMMEMAAESGEGLAIKKGQRPSGGKVLQRLQLYADERHLPFTELVTEGAGGSPKEPPPKKKGKSAALKTAAAPEESDDDSLVAYATALAEAASQLHDASSPPSDTLMATGPGAILGPPTAFGPQWRFVGPTQIPDGQTYGESRPTVSGRVSAVAVDPANANHLLVAAASGGVWESTNRGATWWPRTDYMPTLTTGALAFNPTNSAIVYCGTGEGNFYAGQGAGLLRSTNGGATWAVRCTTPFVGQGFYDLIVDRANGNHLLAACSWGVYESADAGLTWARRLTAQCWDLAMAPAGGASAEVLAACRDGLYRSTNGGNTYTRVTLPGGPANFDRLACDISRSNPAIAYAFGALGTTCYLWRRNAAGTWAAIGNPTGVAVGQAWYDWFLAVSPDNADQIYCGAIEAHRGTLSGGTWTWVTISNKSGDDIHPDQHAIAFDPTNANVVYIGNDGGLFVSNNRGTNWTSLNNGLGITEIEYMAQDFGSSRFLLAGTQDNGSIRYVGSSAWQHVQDGDGGDCGVNRANPDVCYHTFFGMGMERSTAKGAKGTWSWIGPNVPAGYNALFYPPMEVNNDIVAQAGQSVYISRNRGTNWTNIALPAGNTATAMYIPDANNVYVGTHIGNIYRITWNGAAWGAATALTRPRANAWISDLYVQPTNLNRIWATSTTVGGNRCWRSDNGGTAWVNCTAGLPNLPISAVEVHPGNPNRVWVSADVGVYQSFDAGATWAAFANSLPNALAYDLLYQPHSRVLRVALRNRGVWEIPVDGWLTNPVCGVQFTGTLNANQTQRWFTFNWPATWHMVWTVMPTTQQSGAPQLTWRVRVERANAEYVTYWIEVSNLKANAVSFEGRYAILSYY
jgi:hypothetical protein